jgi:hypothetical protein
VSRTHGHVVLFLGSGALGHDRQESAYRHRLREVVERSESHRLGRRVDVGLARQQDHRDARVALANPSEELYSALSRHDDVRDDHVGRERLEHPHRGLHVFGGSNVVTVVLKERRQGYPQTGFVIHDQYACHAYTSLGVSVVTRCDDDQPLSTCRST